MNLNYDSKIYYLIIFILLLVIINILFNQESFYNDASSIKNDSKCTIVPEGPCNSNLCPDGCKPKLNKESINNDNNRCICVKREENNE